MSQATGLARTVVAGEEPAGKRDNQRRMTMSAYLFEAKISLRGTGCTTITVTANSQSQAKQMIRAQYGAVLTSILSCQRK